METKKPMGQQPEHKRRVRYKGTHPRNYHEKYKELQPEKYAETIEKVKKKGSTPAGMHISICVQEILDFCRSDRGSSAWTPRWDMADIRERCWNVWIIRDTSMRQMWIRLSQKRQDSALRIWDMVKIF